jgi:hypothetical protein
LNLGEQLSVSVNISFSSAGAPCVFRYVVNSVFRADFVLATFEQETNLNSSQIPFSNHSISSQPISVVSKPVRPNRKISEPGLKEIDNNRTQKTLFEEFSFVTRQLTQEDEENEEIIVPTQMQKRARYS